MNKAVPTGPGTAYPRDSQVRYIDGGRNKLVEEPDLTTLKNVKHPLVGNEIVRQTLTCLEREIACAQPTIPNGLKKHTGSGSDSDEDEVSVLLQPEASSSSASDPE